VEIQRPRRVTESDMVNCKEYLLELLEDELTVPEP
jgi:hypothetical protein